MDIERMLGLKLTAVQERILDLFEKQGFENIILDREQITRLYLKTYKKRVPSNLNLHLNRLASSGKLYGIPKNGNYRMFCLMKPEFFDFKEKASSVKKKEENTYFREKIVKLLIDWQISQKKYGTIDEICDYFIYDDLPCDFLKNDRKSRNILKRNLYHLSRVKKIYKYRNRNNKMVFSLLSEIGEVFEK